MAEVAEYWWQGRKFKHPETEHMVQFKSLPLEEQKRLNEGVKNKKEDTGKIRPTSEVPSWKQVLKGRPISYGYDGSHITDLEPEARKEVEKEVEKGNLAYETFKATWKGDSLSGTLFYNPKQEGAKERAQLFKEHQEKSHGNTNDIVLGLLLGYGKKNVDAFVGKWNNKDIAWEQARKILPNIEQYFEPDKNLYIK
jgi:hypothetical protein